MARDDTNYTCGCGVHTRKLDEATAHCDTTGHTMTVYGTMAPDVSRQTRKHTPTVAGPTTGGASVGGLDDLRKRFIIKR